MIQTIRDAEQQINLLNREISSLKLKLTQLSKESDKLTEDLNKLKEPKPDINKNIDSILTGDGQTVLHNLHHTFKSIKTDELIVPDLTTGDITCDDLTAGDLISCKRLDIRNYGVLSQLNISHSTADQGFYIMNAGGTTYISSGAKHNGAAWIATSVNCIVIEISGNSAVFMFSNGNTIGASITLHVAATIPTTGSMILTTSLSLAYGGTGGTDAATARNNLGVYSTTIIDNAFTARDNTIATKAAHGTYSVTGGGGGTVTI